MAQGAAAAPPTVPRLDSPVFLFLCRDAPGAPALRERDLAGHLAHVEANWRRYILAGPLKVPGQGAICGSYFLVLAADLDDAWSLMRGDPYLTNGQYESVETLDATASIGLFMGGKIWESAEALVGRAAGS